MGLWAVLLGSFFFFTAHPLHAQPLEPFGKIELSGGGEKESHTPAGGRFTAEALGVWPFTANLGVQGALHYVGGLGSRVGFNLAPVFAFDGGKVGFFVSYQHRGLRDTDFVYLMPAVAFYLPQWNLNAWYSQPVTGAQHGGHRTEYGINKLQATGSYFAGSDWWGPYLRRDNVELIGGLQVNTFAGAGHSKLGGTGFGPILGVSFLPMPGVAVNLVRATFDHEGRYRVATGLEFFFEAKGGTSLKDMRRKYLEPNFDGPQGAGKKHPHSDRRIEVSDRNLKTNIAPIDQREILARVAKMPVQQWNYKEDDASVRHIGPMAQDFHAAFGLGDTDKAIYNVDGNGVALASIQALYQLVQEKDEKIVTLESRLAQLEKGKTHSPLDDVAAAWPFIAMVAVGGVFIARRKFN
jgi:hypothetical protein